MGRFTRCAIVGFVEGGAIGNRIRGACSAAGSYVWHERAVRRASELGQRSPSPSERWDAAEAMRRCATARVYGVYR
jgi:hypothetical protein